MVLDTENLSPGRQTVGIDIGDADQGSCPAKGLSDLGADILCGAGNDDNAIVETKLHL